MATLHTDVRPLAGLGAGEYGVADLLRFQGLAKRGACRLARREAGEEVGDLMDEGMFVADLQARNPPVAHIGMVAVGDVNRTPTAQPAFISMIASSQNSAG